jgi:hypothetical protein
MLEMNYFCIIIYTCSMRKSNLIRTVLEILFKCFYIKRERDIKIETKIANL